MDSTRRAFDPWFDRLESEALFDRPSRLVDLGGWDADELLLPASRYYSRYRTPRVIRPSSYIPERDAAGGEKTISKDNFSVKLDIHQFSPEEVTVKTKDGSLIIQAAHNEREDQHGFISRQFTRRYVLPEDILADKMVVTMSSDGILGIEAPRKSAQANGETVIPIRQTYRPAVVTVTPKSPTPGSGVTSTTGENATHTTREPRSQTIQIEREPATPTTSA